MDLDRLMILSDFDGTIMNVDASELILSRFAHGNWGVYDEQLERGQITLEHCLRKQFGMVREPKKRLIEEVEGSVSFRRGFVEMATLCESKGVPLIVVSSGLDFVIRHLLEGKNLHGLRIVAPKAKATKNGVVIRLPRMHWKDSVEFKQDFVRTCKRKGNRVIYVGDGTSDYRAIREADTRFVIRGSRLASICRTDGIEAEEINDFDDVKRLVFG